MTHRTVFVTYLILWAGAFILSLIQATGLGLFFVPLITIVIALFPPTTTDNIRTKRAREDSLEEQLYPSQASLKALRRWSPITRCLVVLLFLFGGTITFLVFRAQPNIFAMLVCIFCVFMAAFVVRSIAYPILEKLISPKTIR